MYAKQNKTNGLEDVAFFITSDKPRNELNWLFDVAKSNNIETFYLPKSSSRSALTTYYMYVPVSCMYVCTNHHPTVEKSERVPGSIEKWFIFVANHRCTNSYSGLYSTFVSCKYFPHIISCKT